MSQRDVSITVKRVPNPLQPNNNESAQQTLACWTLIKTRYLESTRLFDTVFLLGYEFWSLPVRTFNCMAFLVFSQFTLLQ